RSGIAGREPLLPPAGTSDDAAAIQAAWATLLAYWNRLQTGRGDHIDFSILEATAQVMDPAFGSASGSKGYAFETPLGRPQPGLYPLVPCADGFVRLAVMTPRQWRSLRAWLGEPEEFLDERYDSLPARMTVATQLDALYAEFFKDKQKIQICEEGQA